MSEARITLRQLVAVMEDEIAWMRIYTNGQVIKEENFMSQAEIREAVRSYGDKPVRCVKPGFMFVIVFLDR